MHYPIFGTNKPDLRLIFFIIFFSLSSLAHASFIDYGLQPIISLSMGAGAAQVAFVGVAPPKA